MHDIRTRHYQTPVILRPLRWMLGWLIFTSSLSLAQSVAQQATSPFIRVSKDGSQFLDAAGQPFRVWGVNYDHDADGALLEDYWEKDWPRVIEDFQEIKALGANVVRIHLQLGKFMSSPDTANPAALERLTKLLELAEQQGLSIDLTGLGCYHKADLPAWYDPLSESDRWDVQARFWRAVAQRCANSPALFCYDLMNEPIVAGNKPETEWLAGELAGKFFVQRISLDLKGRTRDQVIQAWVKKLTTAIRDVDDKHLITVGDIPWAMVFRGAKPAFYAPDVAPMLDFVSIHVYPKTGELDRAFEAVESYRIGKPIVIEEFFPLQCSLSEAEQFLDKVKCNGVVSFYWGKTIEENEAAGDLQGKLIAAWLRCFRDRSTNQKAGPAGKGPDPASSSKNTSKAMEKVDVDDVSNWRREHEAKFKSSTGWLALTGHYWLKAGENSFGASATDVVQLPGDAAQGMRGSFSVQTDQRVLLSVAQGESLKVNGKSVQQAWLSISSADGTNASAEGDCPDKITIGERLTLQLVRRVGRLAIRVRDSQSELIRTFSGKRWFPMREQFRVPARFIRFSAPKPIKITNIKGDEVETMFAGALEFSLNGQSMRLDAIEEEPGKLFVIFKDETNGQSTYGAGRFVDVELPESGEIVLDFNKSYNPPCAWSPHTLCPIPPSQNRLRLPIDAGELAPAS